MIDDLRMTILEEIEKLEEENLTVEEGSLLAFNNGRINQCQKILHQMYILSKTVNDKT